MDLKTMYSLMFTHHIWVLIITNMPHATGRPQRPSTYGSPRSREQTVDRRLHILILILTSVPLCPGKKVRTVLSIHINPFETWLKHYRGM